MTDRAATLRMMTAIAPQYPEDILYVEQMDTWVVDVPSVRRCLQRLQECACAYDWDGVNYCLGMLLANDLHAVRDVVLADNAFQQAVASSTTWLLASVGDGVSAQSTRLVGHLVVKLLAERPQW